MTVLYREQKSLNAVMAKGKELTPDQVLSALTAEVGEFFNEIKADWCWWKSNLSIDEDKALEEGVDVLFFALTLDLLTFPEEELPKTFPSEPVKKSLSSCRVLLLNALEAALSRVKHPLAPLVFSALLSYWTQEKVLEAYYAKLRVNYQRSL